MASLKSIIGQRIIVASGDFTPALDDAIGTPTVSHGTQTGKYWRQQDIVFFHLYFRVSSLTAGSFNVPTISGFPFDMNSVYGNNFTLNALVNPESFIDSGYSADPQQIRLGPASGSDEMYFYESSAAGLSNMAASAFVTAPFDIYATGWYIKA